MSRFRKLSHALWHCQYHIVWVPKYRLRILTGQVGEEVRRCICEFSEQLKCEVIEINIQIDHDPAESIGFRLCRNRERADGNPSLQSVPSFEAEALLGQSFLGAWILR